MYVIYILPEISLFVHTGITIATKVSHFKKMVTRDNTFDILVCLSHHTFQRNNGYDVVSSRHLLFYEKNQAKCLTKVPRYISF